MLLLLLLHLLLLLLMLAPFTQPARLEPHLTHTLSWLYSTLAAAPTAARLSVAIKLLPCSCMRATQLGLACAACVKASSLQRYETASCVALALAVLAHPPVMLHCTPHECGGTVG